MKDQLSNIDHGKNLLLNSLHEVLWGFGMAFHSTYAIIPLFLNELNAPAFIVSSVAGIFVVGSAIPQIITAFLGRNTKNLKYSVIAAHALLLPPVFISGIVFTSIDITGPFAWIFYFICYISFTLALGIAFPFWADFLDTAHLSKKRGQFFGISFLFNCLAGLVGGFTVKYMLSSSVKFPTNFGYGFLIYGTCIALATVLFLFYRTTTNVRISSSKTFSEFMKDLKRIMRTKVNFRKYVISRILLTVNYPAISLYAVYMQDKLNFDISEAGTFTIINMSVAAISSYLTGKFGDRHGHKNAMVIIFISYFCALVTCLFSTTLIHAYIIFIFLGFGMGGWITSAMSLIYEFSGQEDTKIYFALTDSLTAPFVLLSIIFTGICIPILGMDVVLIIIGCFMALGILSLMFWTEDPKISQLND